MKTGGVIALRSLQTARFGLLGIQEEDVVHFPHGIPAFEEHREWVFVGEDENPVKWLQSLHDGDVALPVCPPRFVLANYNAHIAAEDLQPLGAGSEAELVLFLVLSIPKGDPGALTANLRAPIVINHVQRIGIQAIAANEDYEVRYRVFQREDQHPVSPSVLSGGQSVQDGQLPQAPSERGGELP